MDLNEALKKLKDNSDLSKPLEKAISRGAKAVEFNEILIEAGVDAENAPMPPTLTKSSNTRNIGTWNGALSPIIAKRYHLAPNV